MEKEKTNLFAPIESIIVCLNRKLRESGYEEILSITFSDKNGARYSYQCPDESIKRTLYY